MTTLLVKHTLQMEKLRPEKGSLPKGPSELLLDCRLKPTLTSHTSCRKNSRAGGLPM